MNIKTIEGNFDNQKLTSCLLIILRNLDQYHQKIVMHVLDIKGLKTENIKFWSLWEEDELVDVVL